MRATSLTLAGLALAALGLAACTQIEPDVGPLLAGGCDNLDSDPGAEVSFSQQVRPLLSRPMGGCSCHVPASGGPGIATQITGLDLSSLGSLRNGGRSSGARIVLAGDPCESVLYQKVSEAPPFGSRMPLNGPPYFSREELTVLHDWIAEGALDN